VTEAISTHNATMTAALTDNMIVLILMLRPLEGLYFYRGTPNEGRDSR
jgi:hypothetical protein